MRGEKRAAEYVLKSEYVRKSDVCLKTRLYGNIWSLVEFNNVFSLLWF